MVFERCRIKVKAGKGGAKGTDRLEGSGDSLFWPLSGLSLLIPKNFSLELTKNIGMMALSF